MGYYTRYSLVISSPGGERIPPSLVELIIKELRTPESEAEFSLDERGNSSEDVRWYAHEEDLRTFSKRYSALLFTLSGEGEEGGDLWSKYFFAGKMQAEKASVQIGPFDPKKLK